MGIKVVDIAYPRFRAPDLDRMEAFLVDFGMVRAARTNDTLYMRGTGAEPFIHVTERGDPAFLGFAFLANSVEDLEKLANEDGASAVESIDAPGGGKQVRFTDPNGFEVSAIAGREPCDELKVIRQPTYNEGHAKRRIGEPLRIDAGPSQVIRFGHCVINGIDFRESEAWYKSRFGLVTSDEILLDKTTALGAFMRCDQGPRHVDHHTLFIIGAGQPGFNHAAFEVENLDDLMAGNAHLTEKDHKHEWGIGRHVLGSQIFDYWRDPWGHTVEHWTDGDLFNNETPPAIGNIEKLLASQWGPPAPATLGS